MKIGRSGYQNIDFTTFTGGSVTIPGIYAKASSGLPLKIHNMIEVGDFFTYGAISGNNVLIPVIINDSGSFIISSLTVTPDNTVSITE